ncbi:hypothetical protein JJB09_06590 [Rhizobium sp. KVB221]|uniref:Alkaline proteinase inhibitor/ Outer membrane lipoprotein Omp19 domain-containing protein n=1 Tax=Rhizobium setariae TaxID=2801340 RepID=A0A937CK16_9HYPH|nr:hypothetical protein [Rhizobium setariae]MBL0371690.1 hypothetical protein [Rhizobium setariae]
MKFRALGLAAIAAGFGYLILMPDDKAATDPVVSSSVNRSSEIEYTVSNMESGTACLIDQGRSVSARSHEIKPGKDCEAVWPGLAAARNWTQNDDGTVVLTNANGEAILTLGLGDGVDFEPLEPANAVLAINVVG